MTVRKNAKFLSFPERDALVRAFVMMKADIVNPAAPLVDRYSRWDEFVAMHRMIQSVNAPGTASPVNFGHGGSGAYGFLPWHRYFLYVLEQRLQSYVPGVTLPYWDWTDPSGTLLVASFLGPDGVAASGYEVRQGYFAKEAPGTGINTTPSPAWWPSGLTGWNLHSALGTWAGALRRRVGTASGLPSATTIRSALDKSTLPEFQNALESGAGTSPFHQLHNALHGWFGFNSHMSNPTASPFDPMFYLHHCNIDRLWAMWQMDGHATEYPTSGGNAHHHRNDPMYPWVGTAPGYSGNISFPPIAMPDFSALGPVTPADVLDHRALGYSYDTQAVIAIALDRTGSMMGITPDPMTTAAPDVTKWEAAKRGVSAFLQDCETAYQSGEVYVVSGVKTFRRLAANDFSAVFAGSPYGLVKPGGGYSQASFDAAVSVLSPGGSTPLADALVDAHASLVLPPFGGLPADERRYLALFTDGIRTSGAPLSSVPDGSLAETAVFAMGFGTGADVDYATLASLVAKGQASLTSQQIYHGENAGVIDKFYSQALAAAIGFTAVMDPVLELFEGEHVHLDFSATSAEDAFFVTVQGMDFEGGAWSYQLIGPDGHSAYSDGHVPIHVHGGGHAERRPHVTARLGKGRLSLMLQRDSADAATWVGKWSLVIAWRARELDAMVMPDPGELLVPVSGGPVRGPRYARLLSKPEERIAGRALPAKPKHRLDLRPPSTGRESRRASTVVVNVYARTRLRVTLTPGTKRLVIGSPVSVEVTTDVLRGSVSDLTGFARLMAPVHDFALLLKPTKLPARLKKEARLPDGGDGMPFDTARVLARLESRSPRLARVRDEELRPVSHHGGALHVHVGETGVPGSYGFGFLVRGTYDPGEDQQGGHHRVARSDSERIESFTRLLSASVGLARGRDRSVKKKASRRRAAKRPKAKRKSS
jgi:hypothetical protein